MPSSACKKKNDSARPGAPHHLYLCASLDLEQLFFFNDTATTEIYTLSLHDALPISRSSAATLFSDHPASTFSAAQRIASACSRSEEHTSELQSQFHIVCRLLLE